MADGITPNAALAIITPTRNNWADAANNNFKILDAIVGSYFVVNALRGIWENSTAYAVNDSVIDSVGGTVWRCLVAHTSAAIPAVFSDQRVAHPTYWSTYTSPARSRGVWLTATSYAVNDFVVNGSQYAICLITHTSGTRATDVTAGKWSVLADCTTPVADDAARAASALVSAGNASTSETNAAASASTATTGASTATTQAGIATAQAVIATTQAGIATTQAGLAATAKTNAETAETNAETAETNAETAETNAAASAALAASLAAGVLGTSTSSVLIGTGSKSFTTQTGKQFNAGQYVTITDQADVNNLMWGTVTSYNSGTGALVVDVDVTTGAGTIAAWNISISGAQGTGVTAIVTASGGLFVNSNTITADYTVATGYNAMSTGPITIASGITVTVSAGSRWAVL